MRPNVNLMKATLTGALGGLLFGFDTVVIAGAIGALVRLYSLDPHKEGLTVAIGLVGTVIGALGAGQIVQRLGAPSHGAGVRSWSSASSAVSASAPLPSSAPSTSPNCHRPSGEDVSSHSSSSMSCSASCSLTCPITSYGPCIWARPSGAGRSASREFRPSCS